ncbi:DDE-type integrase/transposase/recombinase [Aliiruegeria haliotis]|uniref:DDE-type integrase/transposase/recombinase n=1 Tax=Aliiruegeria haliotis TaxID=1280846 RepID=UPI001304AFCA|nr:DDE-type integrase/transposase/recombinase [Aliiruegeria haliotis]
MATDRAVACNPDPVEPRQRERLCQWRWYLGALSVEINGERHYLWRAVDHERDVLESFVTKRRH